MIGVCQSLGTLDKLLCNINWDDTQSVEIRKSLRPQLYFGLKKTQYFPPKGKEVACEINLKL